MVQIEAAKIVEANTTPKPALTPPVDMLASVAPIPVARCTEHPPTPDSASDLVQPRSNDQPGSRCEESLVKQNPKSKSIGKGHQPAKPFDDLGEC